MVHNTLVLDLFLVSAGALISSGYAIRNVIANTHEDLKVNKGFASGAMVLGIVSLSMTLHMFIFKPIPSHYVELFGIALGIFSVIMIGGGLALYLGSDLRPISYLAAIGGIFTLQSANVILSFELTRNPQLSATLFILASLVTLSFLIATHLREDSKYRKISMVVVAILAISMALISGFIGINAYYGHIERVIEAK